MIRKNQYFRLEEMNLLIEEDIKRVISYAESLYRGQLFELASKIYKKKDCRLVTLAGGSCAGKTTSAKLLREILEKMGKKVIMVSLDDFFMDRDKTPLLPDGSKDYDSPRALMLDELHECFYKLFTTGEAKFPSYDFVSGKNCANAYSLKLDNDSIIIFEGLHTISPEITNRLGTKNIFKVYVGPFSGFEFKDTRMDNKDLRFVRRVVRDVGRRGYSMLHTYKVWKNVLDGEKKYIDPYAKKANFVLDTTFAFELGLYKKIFVENYKYYRKEFPKFKFMPVLENAREFNKTLIPLTSLMWEFIDKD